MAWYWIVLLVVAYFVVGTVLFAALTWLNIEIEEEANSIGAIIIWPIVIPFLLIGTSCMYLYNIIRK